MSADPGKIHAAVPHIDTEQFCALCRFGALCRGQQGFRLRATDFKAVPAHLAALDEYCRHAKGRRSRGNGQAARIAANHANVGSERFRHNSLAFERIITSRLPERRYLTALGGYLAPPRAPAPRTLTDYRPSLISRAKSHGGPNKWV